MNSPEPEPIDNEFNDFLTENQDHIDVMHNFTIMFSKFAQMKNEISRLTRVIDNQVWVHERLTDALIELLNKNDDDVYMEQ